VDIHSSAAGASAAGVSDSSQSLSAGPAFRVLSLEWVVQCLTCGVRLRYDDPGYESATTVSTAADVPAEEAVVAQIATLNTGTFRLPLTSELDHIQVYKSPSANAERYQVHDVVLMDIETAASDTSAAAAAKGVPHKRSKASARNKGAITNPVNASYKMGKIISFVTTETNKTAVRVRLIHLLPANADAPPRVQLSATQSLLVAVDRLQGKALVLRRADYDSLKYIQRASAAASSAVGAHEVGGLYCASEEWEEAEERGDVQFAKQYYPQLFQERVEPADEEEADEEEEEEDEEEAEAWQALPMSQDY
jgi:hypothetical protein